MGHKLKRFLILVTVFTFSVNTFGFVPVAQAGEFILPKPGTMVRLSAAFNPPVLKGIKVHPDNPFRFDFVLDTGDGTIANLSRPDDSGHRDFFKQESTKLIKYFLASLTTPEKDLWVNLSPYEKNRIVPDRD